MISIRLLLFSFLLFGNVFSYYADPPNQDVEIANRAASATIQNNYVSKGPAKVPSIDDPVKFADARILTVMPSVDDRITDKANSTVFWIYGIDYENAVSGPNSLSDDRCSQGHSTATFISASANPRMLFLYKNKTKELNPEGFFQVIPFDESELSSEQQEKLNITLHGNITLKYARTDTYQTYTCLGYSEGHCDSYGCFPFTDEKQVEIVKPFSHSVLYEVENGGLVHFLSSPVLREQWYKNNVFNSIILSKRKFTRGIFRLNNISISNASFYVFNVTTDGYGIKSIKSIELYNASNAEATQYNSSNLSIPGIQTSDVFFPYILQFNASYEALGRNSLSLELGDHFLNTFFVNESILSRKVSFNGVIEGNRGNDLDSIRPSIVIKDEYLYANIVSLGAVTILIFLVFFRK